MVVSLKPHIQTEIVRVPTRYIRESSENVIS